MGGARGRRRLGYAAGHALNDGCAAVWFTYALSYLAAVAGVGQREAGALVLLGQLVDGFATPVVGLLCDTSPSCGGFGRRRPYHLGGVVLVAGSFPFIFGGFPFAQGALQVPVLASAVTLFQVGWATSQVSHLALVPDLAASPEERTSLNSLRYGTTVACSLGVYVACWLLFGTSDMADVGLGPEALGVFRWLAIGIVTTGVLAAAVFHVCLWGSEEGAGAGAGAGAQLEGRLYVTVGSARGLPRGGLLRRVAQPYVVLQVGSQRWCSDPCLVAGSRPVWNERTKFKVAGTAARLQVQLWSRGVFRNFLVAMAGVDLGPSVMTWGKCDLTVPLVPPGQSHAAGEVVLFMSYARKAPGQRLSLAVVGGGQERPPPEAAGAGAAPGPPPPALRRGAARRRSLSVAPSPRMGEWFRHGVLGEGRRRGSSGADGPPAEGGAPLGGAGPPAAAVPGPAGAGGPGAGRLAEGRPPPPAPSLPLHLRPPGEAGPEGRGGGGGWAPPGGEGPQKAWAQSVASPEAALGPGKSARGAGGGAGGGLPEASPEDREAGGPVVVL